MKKRSLTHFLLASALAVLFGSSGLIGSVVHAAPGGGGGGGGGGDDAGVPPDLGDLFIIYRDLSGFPILTPADGDTGLCQQPTAVASELCGPEMMAELCADQVGTCVIPVDPATCGILAPYSVCTGEVDFGRTNSIRSPDAVFDSQLDDVLVNLATADCISLDPAGRLVASMVGDEGEVDSRTIDSPLQNLAIYRQVMLNGSLGVPLPDGLEMLDMAARGMGVATDKSGMVTIDMLVYANQIMGISDRGTSTILGLPTCMNIREEVNGNVQLVERCFLDYSTYTYERGLNFSIDQESLPAPAYIPSDDPLDGYFEYLAPLGGNAFQIVQGSIQEAVFCPGTVSPNSGLCSEAVDPGYTLGNIGGFAQAADDTRAVINYMHTWPVPGDFETPIVCDVQGEPGDGSFDLSISTESGFQVPTQVVSTTEGREFIVTVGYSGRNALATGYVEVTAVTGQGPVLVDGEEGPFVFEFADVGPAGFTTGPVIFTIGEPHAKDTISWTATVVAPGDVLAGNNTVLATSSVRTTGGGRR